MMMPTTSAVAWSSPIERFSSRGQSSCAELLFGHPVLFDLPIERSLADAKHLRRIAAVPSRLAQRGLDHGPLDLLHRHSRLDRHDVLWRGADAARSRPPAIAPSGDAARARRRGHRLRVADPRRRAATVVIETATKLLDLKLELEQAADDELELPALRASCPRTTGPRAPAATATPPSRICRGKSFGWISCPGESTTMLSTRFRSSRTLPGHG